MPGLQCHTWSLLRQKTLYPALSSSASRLARGSSLEGTPAQHKQKQQQEWPQA